ncbi:hippurate hydrolase [Sulfitobacter brevis]|uniref:Hippurate hydrolase n=1 Tax=Sulfitobacter brevis TaxID=74348 RepID=A0A1I2BJ10_9RHOB|nr:amidohydrolase [Sulfitobacter brevis]SFE55253.1 hippurate hydrolase [Sulfitobacter brevis]
MTAELTQAIDWRHDLHRHPELLYDLPWTSGFVAERLREMGMDSVTTGVGRSGVVAVLQGERPGPVTALRADMDALPITEATGAPHASLHQGRMHACGHDGHMAMLLLAARRVATQRDFAGTAVFIFQPAEENGGAGARAMLQDGLITRFGMTQIFGMHCMPGLQGGQFFTRPKGIMAAADSLRITIEGRGGHAARPDTCVDPALVASHIHVALQSIVSRNIDPVASAVISITQMEASDNEDIIAPIARLAGTVRTLDEAVRDHCEAAITRIATGVAAAHGAQAKVEYLRDYPVTVNAPAAMARAARSAAAVAPTQIDTPPLMVSEDFSFMLQALEGAFLFLGQGDGPGLHSPTFEFNDAVLNVGARFWEQLIRDQ